MPIIANEETCAVMSVLRSVLNSGVVGGRGCGDCGDTEGAHDGDLTNTSTSSSTDTPPAAEAGCGTVSPFLPPLNISTPAELLATLRSVPLRPMSSGCFYSTSGSDNQNWHTDGPTLMGGGGAGLEGNGDGQTLLPYAINVFVPLVPMNSRNGTEFLPGSHLSACTRSALKALLMKREGPATSPSGAGQSTLSFDEAQWEKHFASKTSPSVSLGSALLFDYRVEHRGLGNKAFNDRPCVYMTYAQPWYLDTYNFDTKRYAHTLELPEGWGLGRGERAARRELMLSQQQEALAEQL